MTYNKRTVGNGYENRAADYLESCGLSVVDMNYSCRYGEIDIVARDGRYLVFTEVKYRSSAKYGFPQEAVDKRKQKTIAFVANYYIMKHKYPPDIPVRFDVVAILGSDIIHIPNAFEASNLF